MKIYVKDNKALRLNSKFLSPVASGETWVINENPQVSGIVEEGDYKTFNADFESNNQQFVNIDFFFPSVMIGMEIFYDDIQVYNNLDDIGEPTYAWIDNTYRTITFANPVTDSDLLAWLQANAIKQ